LVGGNHATGENNMATRTVKAKAKISKAKSTRVARKSKGASPNTVAGIIALGGAALGFGASLLFS
jgi:hypothetical protein